MEIGKLNYQLEQLNHRQHYKLFIRWEKGKDTDCQPGETEWCKIQKHWFSMQKFGLPINFTNGNAIILNPDIKGLLIYEAHVGMATSEEKVGSFIEFRDNVLATDKKSRI